MNDKNKYLIIIVAFALAVLGAMFYNVKSREASQPKGHLDSKGAAVEEVKILVASRAIDAGVGVTQSNFEWRNWPKEDLNDEYFTSDRKDLSKLNGAIVRQSISAHEPLRASDLYLKGDQNALAVLLKPGTLAVALPLKFVDNAHMLYHPGDIIDVILPKRTDNIHTKGIIILNSVKIIAVDDRFSIPVNEKIEKMPLVLILQLTLGQAQKLSTALIDGHLLISQHSAGAGISQEEPAEKEAPEVHENKITIIRGGQGGSTSVVAAPLPQSTGN